MNFDMFVSQQAEALPAGSTRRVQCPACQGGDKGETSFVVGREPNRVWFKCFRAKCGVSGIVGSANLAPAIAAEVSRAMARIRPYRDPILRLLPADEDYFTERFELTVTGTEVGVTVHDEYILPVRGPNFDLRGHVQRQPVWKGEPRAPRAGRTWDPDANEGKGGPMVKTKVYPLSTQPLLAWYPSHADHDRAGTPDRYHLVVVEDQISAMKCAQAGVNAVALLGNGMNIEMVRDIVKARPSTVTIALDPGAEGQAQSLAKKFGLYFRRTRVVALEADPKDILMHSLLEELGL